MTTAAQPTTTETKPAVVAGTSLIQFMAGRYNLEPAKFLSTLIKTVFPSDKQNASNEQVAAFLAVAKQYDLNPFIKEIYAFPGKSGGIVPIVSIDGWSTLINRQSALDGIEFEDQLDDTGELRAVTAVIYRKDRGHPTRVIEYMNECRRNTEPWQKWPARMLRHKALIQCARVAFGLAGIYDPDEAERIAEAEQAQIAQANDHASKTERMAAQLQNRPAVTDEPTIDIQPETDAEPASIETKEPDKPVDEKKEKKRLRDSIKNKFAELGWDEKRGEQFLDGRDILVLTVEELTKYNRSLTEILAET
jgi:phage recombination protein Bet